MNSFEKNHTRWLDGEMPEEERLRFEAMLDEQTLLAGRAWQRVRPSLARAMKNDGVPRPDFRDARLRETAERSSERTRYTRRPSPSPVRLAWTGLAFLATAAMLGAWCLPRVFPMRDPALFSSHVISIAPASPDISASTFPAPDRRGTVIWLEGTPFIPADQRVP